jgi:hypothetical protein
MVGMGFEPMKHNACELKSHPFDRSGNLPYLDICVMFLSSFIYLIYFDLLLLINILYYFNIKNECYIDNIITI